MANTETVLEQTKQTKMKAWFTLFLLLGLILLCMTMELPPTPVANDAPETEFSAERAMQHLERIAQAPHPTGSVEHAKVRQYLVEQLTQLGLEVKVEHSQYVDPSNHFVNSVDVHNVIGSIKGSGGDKQKQVVLMAHYDSVPTGPGANDNGVAVSALLEVAKILQSEPQLQNDILFAFTDAEEIGLIGAQEFWDMPGRIDGTGIVVNLEARGSKGASLMFQTSPQNDWLIREFAQVAPRPVTSSLLSSFYEKMPNDTDLTIAIEAGMPGINFAYGQGWTVYHTTRDSLENVDLRTLQHHGENALYLARHFGNLDLTGEQPQSNRVFFSVLGKVFHYSENFVLPFTIFLTILYTLVFVYGWRKKLSSIRELGSSFGMLLGASVITLAVLVPLWLLVDRLWAHKMTMLAGGLYNSMLYNISFLLLTIGICLIVWQLMKVRLNHWAVLLSTSFVWLLILIGFTVFLKGATYLFAWPLFISLIVTGIAMLRPQKERSIRSFISITLFVIPPVLLFTTILQLFYGFLPVGINVFVNVLVVFVLAMLYVPLKEVIVAFKWMSLIPVGIALVLLGTTWALGTPSESRQVNSNLFYVLDSDTEEAKWTTILHPNEWTSEYVSEENPSVFEKVLPGAGDAPLWVGDAPVVSMPHTEVEVLEKGEANGEQSLHLRIKTDENTSMLYLILPETNASSIQLAEQTIPLEIGEDLYLKQTGIPDGGLDVTINCL
ncbi:M28 family peptidase [Bacillus horti]|uniref:Peptidase M28 domain-containing protein n=1 Tax=Caldalkalibacillus horti TaxID=77523 RepID=A0ABT9VVM0_9BACI|nr:M28 family peptidase [Bacillus horti]MDQ0165038.1 hypothetical protein [Bacillus horti]